MKIVYISAFWLFWFLLEIRNWLVLSWWCSNCSKVGWFGCKL